AVGEPQVFVTPRRPERPVPQIVEQRENRLGRREDRDPPFHARPAPQEKRENNEEDSQEKKADAQMFHGARMCRRRFIGGTRPLSSAASVVSAIKHSATLPLPPHLPLPPGHRGVSNKI